VFFVSSWFYFLEAYRNANHLHTAKLGLCTFFLFVAQLAWANSRWSHKPGSDINWQHLTDLGTLRVGVNLDTGETNRQVWLKDKTPDYKGDEIMGRVFNIRDSKELIASPVQ
jgi:hypothetical protein